jgi:hypothetical protein
MSATEPQQAQETDRSPDEIEKSQNEAKDSKNGASFLKVMERVLGQDRAKPAERSQG